MSNYISCLEQKVMKQLEKIYIWNKYYLSSAKNVYKISYLSYQIPIPTVNDTTYAILYINKLIHNLS